jgi:hypothetical protein
MSRISLVFLLLSLTFFLPTPAVAQTFSTPGSWSYTVPAGVTRVQVQVSGGGGGGGGGGFTAGAGGSSVNDFTSAIAGGGGGSCQHNSADISSTSIAATGGTGAMGRTARSSTAGSPGSNGSVVITPGPLEVQKTSVVTSDAVSGANPKFLPGATIRYCVFIRNNWGATLQMSF